MRFFVLASDGDELIEGLRRRHGCRVEAVEAERLDLERGGHAQHFIRQLDHEAALVVDRVGHRVIRQRRGKEHGAVGLLAPQVAPDVVGHADVAPVAQRPLERPQPWGHGAIELTQHEGTATAKVDQARLEVVGGEVHESSHSSLLANQARDDELVQTVLQ